MRLFKRDDSRYWFAAWWEWTADGRHVRRRRCTRQTDRTAAHAIALRWERDGADPASARRASTTVNDVLAALDPVAVAAEVCGAVVQHRAWVALQLSPALSPADEPDAAALAVGSDLGLTVQHLTAYARTGALGDWPDDTCAIDAVQSVLSALYSRAGDRRGYHAPEITEDADPSTAIGVVVLAAIARSRLAERRQVRLSWLAALASVATSRLRQLVTSGEIRTTDGHVRADDARRWLAARDVPGYRDHK